MTLKWAVRQMRQGLRHLLLAGTPLCKGTLFLLELDARDNGLLLT